MGPSGRSAALRVTTPNPGAAASEREVALRTAFEAIPPCSLLLPGDAHHVHIDDIPAIVAALPSDWGWCDVNKPHQHRYPWTAHDGEHPHRLAAHPTPPPPLDALARDVVVQFTPEMVSEFGKPHGSVNKHIWPQQMEALRKLRVALGWGDPDISPAATPSPDAGEPG